MSSVVGLALGTRRWTAWRSVSIEQSIESMVGQFTLEVIDRERTGDLPIDIDAGAAVRIDIDGEQLIAGHVDTASPSIDGQSHAISLTGRDRAADLVDCSAIAKPGSWNNAPFEKIVADIVAPFAIAVAYGASTGKPIRKFAIQPGETVHSAVERLCRFRALIFYSLPDGSLFIGSPSAEPATIDLIEGINILSASVEHNMAERFSDYIVKGQRAGSDDVSGASASGLSATATDPGVKRHRPLVIVAEEQAGPAELKTRAEWEANVRAAKAQTVTIAVQGWKVKGELLRFNRRYRVKVPSLRIDAELLCFAITYSRDDGGTIAQLQLQRAEAWAQLPVPENAEAGRL